MTKKVGPGWDPRADADEDGTSGEGLRVDRVFDGSRPSRPAVVSQPPPPRRTKAATLPPRPVGEAADTELALRRQLSRLQRQLADAQRELANKDDELATEAESRLAVATEHDKLVEETRAKDQQLEELVAFQTRAQGIEERLREISEAGDEVAVARDEEREQKVIALARVRELESVLADAQQRWTAERTALEFQHGSEMGQLELERKAAAETAETTLAATTGRLQKAQEEQLASLRESHEKSLALLRGELEPKALEARKAAEETSRLSDELAALRTESLRLLAEKDEQHARELAQQVESHTAGQAAGARVHAADVARLSAERDNLKAEVEQAKQSAVDREKLVEQTVAQLRETQKTLTRELAEAKEAHAQLQSDFGSLEERLRTAQREVDALAQDNRELRTTLDNAERQGRENALDRQRFIAYLEEGLAMLGAIPPQEATGSHPVVPAAAASETFSVSFTGDKPGD